MPIASAFAPNYTLKDVAIAVNQLLPWNWGRLQTGGNVPEFEKRFAVYLGVPKAVSFESGRSGFYAVLKEMGVGEGDEVILQAFTTVALSNTIRALGARPIYVDIEKDSMNMDPSLIEERITPATKAIVIQHTFGNPAKLHKILEIAKRNGIMTIEDAAHALGGEYQGKKLGTFADAAFFSFGRDKVISAVAGGMVIAQDPDLIDRIEATRNGLDYPAKREIVRHLLHPVITFTALHTYDLLSLGKAIMYLSFRGKLLNKAYTEREKSCSSEIPRRMPDALAAIALNQLAKTDDFNEHRRTIAAFYEKNIKNPDVTLPETASESKNIFLWYTILVPEKHRLIMLAADEDIILGDWFPQAVGPIEVDMEKAGYDEGSCPVAEEIAEHCVNLPTHHNIHTREAQKVVDFINGYK